MEDDDERRKKRAEYQREWRRLHPGYYTSLHPEWNQKWRAKNPEKVAENQHRAYLRNPKRAKARVAQWRKDNSERHKESARLRHARYTARKMGLTPEQFEILRPKLNGPCDLCGAMKPMRIDHDHTTGKFRGLLCQKCNLGIGFLGDCGDGLLKALDYLKRVFE